MYFEEDIMRRLSTTL